MKRSSSILSSGRQCTITESMIRSDSQLLAHEAERRWLWNEEIYSLLMDWKQVNIPLLVDQIDCPPSGTLVFCNRKTSPWYKKDGWEWKKKAGQTVTREDYFRLKIDAKDAILCSAVHSMKCRTFHRRIYRLLNSESPMVLIHYFDSSLRSKPTQKSTNFVYRQNKGPPSMIDTFESPSDEAGASISDLDQFLSSDDVFDPWNFDDGPSSLFVLPESFDVNLDHHSELQHHQGLIPSSRNITILDYSPDWDFTEGGAKVLICFQENLPGAIIDHPSSLKIAFGSAMVSATKISNSVLRCIAPPVSTSDNNEQPTPSSVLLQVMQQQGLDYVPISDECSFSYHFSPAFVSPADVVSSPSTTTTHARGTRNCAELSSCASTSSLASEESTSPRSKRNTDDMMSTSEEESNVDERQIRTFDRCWSEFQRSMLGQIKKEAEAEEAESSMYLDDPAVAQLPEPDLEDLSERMTENVVRQLLVLADSNEELTEELNSPDPAGMSLIHYICFYNLPSLISMALHHGAKVNEANAQGLSPLHLAAGCGHADVVRTLVEHGADVHLKDPSGSSCADRAHASGHTSLAQYLRSFARQDQSSCVSSGLTLDPASTTHSSSGQDYNRQLLLGAFSSMSLHDKCALSLSMLRLPMDKHDDRSDESDALKDAATSDGSKHFASDDDDDDRRRRRLHASSNFPNHLHPSGRTTTPQSSSLRLSDFFPDDDNELDQSQDQIDAAMKLMSPAEITTLEEDARKIQSNVRAWLLRKSVKNMRETTKCLTEAAQSRQSHQYPRTTKRQRVEKAAVTVQAATRSMLARKNYLNTRSVAIRCQAVTRGALCRKNFARMKTQALASLVIQRNVRAWFTKASTMVGQPQSSRAR